MKPIASALAVFLLSFSVYSQSGRRPKDIRVPTPPPPEATTTESNAKPAAPVEPPPVTAEKNQDYRCTDDGSLARILESDAHEPAVPVKEVDTLAVIKGKPRPSYTKEARRLGIQGFVTVKVLLSARGEIARVRVVKGLRAGLTENAIRAACKMEFKPATKDGQPVAQWLTAEYVFRLADSSIFSP